MGVRTTLNIKDAAGDTKTLRTYSEANDGSGPLWNVGLPVLGDAENVFWSYAPSAGGISNTTSASIILGAQGSGRRSYVTSLQLIWNTLGAATEVVLRETGGSVLWRGMIGTAAGSLSIQFATALKPAANVQIEFATVSAVSGNVLVNVQGFVGA